MEGLSLTELKELCKSHGVKITGKKAELIERLKFAIENPGVENGKKRKKAEETTSSSQPFITNTEFDETMKKKSKVMTDAPIRPSNLSSSQLPTNQSNPISTLPPMTKNESKSNSNKNGYILWSLDQDRKYNWDAAKVYLPNQVFATIEDVNQQVIKYFFEGNHEYSLEGGVYDLPSESITKSVDTLGLMTLTVSLEEDRIQWTVGAETYEYWHRHQYSVHSTVEEDELADWGYGPEDEEDDDFWCS
jgi:hypothetical protein